MTAGLANAIRKGFFAYTNNEKGTNHSRADRVERKTVSNLQTFSATGETMDLVKDTKIGSSIAETLSATTSSRKAVRYLSKAADVASDLVNPLLVVASAARVYGSDDKESAAIREGSAMTSMFLVEGQMKKIMGLNKGTSPTYADNKYLKNIAEGIKNFCAKNKFLSKLPQNKLTSIIKAAIFVTGSCSAFAAGTKIGNYIADNTTARAYQKRQLEKANSEYAQTKQLTTTKDTSATNFVA